MTSMLQQCANHSKQGRRPRTIAVGTGLVLAAALAATSASAALAVGVPGSSGYLAAAESFAVLGGTTVTNTGAPTHVWGDVGVAPGTTIIGFQSNQVGGTRHAGDSTATNAQLALTDAYNAAAAATPSDSVNHSAVGNQTFLPGVYGATSTMDLTGTVTLDGRGDPRATWVFKAGSTLTTATSSRVLVINGNPCNVFWQVGSSATIGGSTSFVGTVLANTAITAVTSATIDGRLLARNAAVTLDSNQITQPVCSLTDATGVTAPPSSPSPSPSPSSSTTPAPTATPTSSPSASASPSTPTPSATAGAGTGAGTGTGTGAGTSPAPSASTGATPAPSATKAPRSSAPVPGSTRAPRSTPAKTTAPTVKHSTSGSGSGTSGTSGTGSTTGSSDTSGSSGRLATTGSDISAPLALAGGLIGLGALLFAASSLRRVSRRR